MGTSARRANLDLNHDLVHKMRKKFKTTKEKAKTHTEALSKMAKQIQSLSKEVQNFLTAIEKRTLLTKEAKGEAVKLSCACVAAVDQATKEISFRVQETQTNHSLLCERPKTTINQQKQLTEDLHQALCKHVTLHKQIVQRAIRILKKSSKLTYAQNAQVYRSLTKEMETLAPQDYADRWKPATIQDTCKLPHLSTKEGLAQSTSPESQSPQVSPVFAAGGMDRILATISPKFALSVLQPAYASSTLRTLPPKLKLARFSILNGIYFSGRPVPWSDELLATQYFTRHEGAPMGQFQQTDSLNPDHQSSLPMCVLKIINSSAAASTLMVTIKRTIENAQQKIYQLLIGPHAWIPLLTPEERSRLLGDAENTLSEKDQDSLLKESLDKIRLAEGRTLINMIRDEGNESKFPRFRGRSFTEPHLEPRTVRSPYLSGQLLPKLIRRIIAKMLDASPVFTPPQNEPIPPEENCQFPPSANLGSPSHIASRIMEPGHLNLRPPEQNLRDLGLNMGIQAVENLETLNQSTSQTSQVLQTLYDLNNKPEVKNSWFQLSRQNLPRPQHELPDDGTTYVSIHETLARQILAKIPLNKLIDFTAPYFFEPSTKPQEDSEIYDPRYQPKDTSPPSEEMNLAPIFKKPTKLSVAKLIQHSKALPGHALTFTLAKSEADTMQIERIINALLRAMVESGRIQAKKYIPATQAPEETLDQKPTTVICEGTEFAIPSIFMRKCIEIFNIRLSTEGTLAMLVQPNACLREMEIVTQELIKHIPATLKCIPDRRLAKFSTLLFTACFQSKDFLLALLKEGQRTLQSAVASYAKNTIPEQGGVDTLNMLLKFISDNPDSTPRENRSQALEMLARAHKCAQKISQDNEFTQTFSDYQDLDQIPLPPSKFSETSTPLAEEGISIASSEMLPELVKYISDNADNRNSPLAPPSNELHTVRTKVPQPNFASRAINKIIPCTKPLPETRKVSYPNKWITLGAKYLFSSICAEAAKITHSKFPKVITREDLDKLSTGPTKTLNELLSANANITEILDTVDYQVNAKEVINIDRIGHHSNPITILNKIKQKPALITISNNADWRYTIKQFALKNQGHAIFDILKILKQTAKLNSELGLRKKPELAYENTFQIFSDSFKEAIEEIKNPRPSSVLVVSREKSLPAVDHSPWNLAGNRHILHPGWDDMTTKLEAVIESLSPIKKQTIQPKEDLNQSNATHKHMRAVEISRTNTTSTPIGFGIGRAPCLNYKPEDFHDQQDLAGIEEHAIQRSLGNPRLTPTYWQKATLNTVQEEEHAPLQSSENPRRSSTGVSPRSPGSPGKSSGDNSSLGSDTDQESPANSIG